MRWLQGKEEKFLVLFIVLLLIGSIYALSRNAQSRIDSTNLRTALKKEKTMKKDKIANLKAQNKTLHSLLEDVQKELAVTQGKLTVLEAEREKLISENRWFRVSRGLSFRCPYRELLEKYFGLSLMGEAHRVMKAESSCNPRSLHYEADGSISYGVFQLNNWGVGKGYTVEELYDSETNIRIAAEYVKKHGWGAWSTARKLGIR